MTIALFIVGRSGSGKTTLSKMLEPLGVFRISASAQLMDLYLSEFREVPSRLQLADYGKTLLRHKRLERFHSALKAQMANREAICVDGLRFSISVDELSKYARRSSLIYLRCPQEIRELRLSSTFSNGELRTLSAHETEVAVDAMGEQADVVIDTSKPIDAAFKQVESALTRLRATT